MLNLLIHIYKSLTLKQKVSYLISFIVTIYITFFFLSFFLTLFAVLCIGSIVSRIIKKFFFKNSKQNSHFVFYKFSPKNSYQKEKDDMIEINPKK